MKPSTQPKQMVTEYPAIEAGKTYIFRSHGRVECKVISIGAYVVYRKPKGFGQCPLLTFQRLYKQYGVEG